MHKDGGTYPPHSTASQLPYSQTWLEMFLNSLYHYKELTLRVNVKFWWSWKWVLDRWCWRGLCFAWLRNVLSAHIRWQASSSGQTCHSSIWWTRMNTYWFLNNYSDIIISWLRGWQCLNVWLKETSGRRDNCCRISGCRACRAHCTDVPGDRHRARFMYRYIIMNSMNWVDISDQLGRLASYCSE